MTNKLLNDLLYIELKYRKLSLDFDNLGFDGTVVSCDLHKHIFKYYKIKDSDSSFNRYLKRLDFYTKRVNLINDDSLTEETKKFKKELLLMGKL